jgi:hypothetical protein
VIAHVAPDFDLLEPVKQLEAGIVDAEARVVVAPNASEQPESYAADAVPADAKQQVTCDAESALRVYVGNQRKCNVMIECVLLLGHTNNRECVLATLQSEILKVNHYKNNIDLQGMKYQKMSDELQEQVRSIVLQLRFRTTKPTTKSYKYIGYARIAKAVRLTCYEIQHICRKAVCPKRPLTVR